MKSKVTLEKVKRMYAIWGRLPFLYSAQDYVTFLGRPGLIRRAAVKKLCLEKGSRVLEVACGTGRNFQYLLEAVGERGLLVGLDYTREMLSSAAKLCRKRGWENVQLVEGDAARIDLPDGDFDGVLCVLGISAIPEWEQALSHCKRVLRPGGVVSVCDARLFEKPLHFLNPAVKAVYSKLAAWDSSRNIPQKMEELFGNVEVQNFNQRTFFVAASRKGVN